ncbi:ABC transporter substrate-binding protein [Anaerocolumna sp. MB42-C2]|uniref:ABC transporter substrate-binding protein n=1 Tax=Anaerocolumna sp. MB42-C2 TaxID=3070997 RepID=UPI0027DFF152|nr:ABC transporter substrate-binding protein [Anaerocolumna sp. MB42-C2]WMJ87284.1 ABC transporter substrate-binding protein [Anaerocolumna sp. MB42-C2]
MRSSKLIKKIVAVCLAGVLLVGLTGCGSKTEATTSNTDTNENVSPADQTATEEADSSTAADSTEAGSGTTDITFWYSWTDLIQQNNIALTDEFNNTVGKEKGIHVTAEYQGTYDDLHQKLQAAYVAGTTPEVTVMEIASIKTFAMNGVLEPLDPYIKKSGVDLSDFQEGLMKNSYYENACYGLPYLRSTPIMYMNTTMLKNAGLDPKGPSTWDELAQYAKTIHEKTGKYGLSQFSYIWTFEAFMMEHGSSVLNEDETAGNLNTQQAKDIVNFFKDLKKDGSAHLISSAESDKLQADIMNQETAIWFSSTGDLTNNLKIAKDNGFELNTAFIPKDVQYGVPTGGCNLIMTTNITDEEKDAAWEFIQWMTEKEQTIKASKNTGYLPSRISAKDSDEMLSLYEEIPQFKVALDQLTYSTGRPMNPGYTEATKAIQDALDAVWVNDQDVDKTLEDLETKVNTLLNE